MVEGGVSTNEPSVGPMISIVVPCYNEEQSLPILYRELTSAFATRPNVDYELVFVDDGSTDRTAEILEGLAVANRRVTVITLSRNFGHQSAISAGLSARLETRSSCATPTSRTRLRSCCR